VTCPNCNGMVEEHINSTGGGSRYCLDGCGYYEELPDGSMRPRRKEKAEPPRPKPPKRPTRR
jgi:hypothetical protein